MKLLLTITAVLEAGTGLGLVLAPALVALLLLGAPLDAPAAVTVARVTGAALIALGVACWLSRDNGRALLVAILFYNVVATAILAHAALGLSLTSIGLWPAIGLHALLAVWALFSLLMQAKPNASEPL